MWVGFCNPLYSLRHQEARCLCGYLLQGDHCCATLLVNHTDVYLSLGELVVVSNRSVQNLCISVPGPLQSVQWVPKVLLGREGLRGSRVVL